VSSFDLGAADAFDWATGAPAVTGTLLLNYTTRITRYYSLAGATSPGDTFKAIPDQGRATFDCDIPVADTLGLVKLNSALFTGDLTFYFNVGLDCNDGADLRVSTTSTVPPDSGGMWPVQPGPPQVQVQSTDAKDVAQSGSGSPGQTSGMPWWITLEVDGDRKHLTSAVWYTSYGRPYGRMAEATVGIGGVGTKAKPFIEMQVDAPHVGPEIWPIIGLVRWYQHATVQKTKINADAKATGQRGAIRVRR
jgi:hypothetical protein